MQQGFSKFSWALALFCLPSALFPLAWFVSPSFSENPNLSETQVDLFSIAFWIYPIVLLVLAALLHKLHRKRPALASGLLIGAFCLFYLGVYAIFRAL